MSRTHIWKLERPVVVGAQHAAPLQARLALARECVFWTLQKNID
jgi:hypothetical protein